MEFRHRHCLYLQVAREHVSCVVRTKVYRGLRIVCVLRIVYCHGGGPGVFALSCTRWECWPFPERAQVGGLPIASELKRVSNPAGPIDEALLEQVAMLESHSCKLCISLSIPYVPTHIFPKPYARFLFASLSVLRAFGEPKRPHSIFILSSGHSLLRSNSLVLPP